MEAGNGMRVDLRRRATCFVLGYVLDARHDQQSPAGSSLTAEGETPCVLCPLRRAIDFALSSTPLSFLLFEIFIRYLRTMCDKETSALIMCMYALDAISDVAGGSSRPLCTVTL